MAINPKVHLVLSPAEFRRLSYMLAASREELGGPNDFVDSDLRKKLNAALERYQAAGHPAIEKADPEFDSQVAFRRDHVKR